MTSISIRLSFIVFYLFVFSNAFAYGYQYNAGSKPCVSGTGDEIKLGPTQQKVEPGYYADNIQVNPSSKAEGWKELWCSEKQDMREFTSGQVTAFYIEGYADCGSGEITGSKGHAILICDVSYDKIKSQATPQVEPDPPPPPRPPPWSKGWSIDGVFKLWIKPFVYYAENGHYCWFDTRDHYVQLSNSPITRINARLSESSMKFDGICTGHQSTPSLPPDND